MKLIGKEYFRIEAKMDFRGEACHYPQFFVLRICFTMCVECGDKW